MSDQPDPTQDPDAPEQQSVERERVEQERKLSSPDDAEGGERGTDDAGGDAESKTKQNEQQDKRDKDKG